MPHRHLKRRPSESEIHQTLGGVRAGSALTAAEGNCPADRGREPRRVDDGDPSAD